MDRKIITHFSPEDLILLYIGLYNQDFGNQKGLEILNKVNSSTKISEFVNKLLLEKLSPGKKGFITIVNSAPYFFFSKGETLAYGALFAIQQWLEKSSSDSNQLSTAEVYEIILDTIYSASKTKINLSGKLSFFEKYFNLLESIYNRDIQLSKEFNKYSETIDLDDLM